MGAPLPTPSADPIVLLSGMSLGTCIHTFLLGVYLGADLWLYQFILYQQPVKVPFTPHSC